MSEYVKECIFCKAKIRMSDKRENKWRPYNEDGSEHDCKNKNGNKSVPNNGNDLSVEVLLKRLESVGVKLDLSKLRNVK
jgi:hypothetical protein